jgi:hypothetical protein
VTATSDSTTNDDRIDNPVPTTTTAVPSALSRTHLRRFPIPRLDGIVHNHFRATQSASLAVSGRYLELLYVLIATLVCVPHHKTVSVVDFEGRFDPLRLLTTAVHLGDPTHSVDTRPTTPRRSDLDHVHILRPSRGDATHVAGCVASMEEHMLYGSHCSRTREWWGTVVIGGGLNPAGGAGHVAAVADWKGWLRVDRVEVPQFLDVGVEEAIADRERRQRAVEEAGWMATSPWGALVFGRRRGT